MSFQQGGGSAPARMQSGEACPSGLCHDAPTRTYLPAAATEPVAHEADWQREVSRVRACMCSSCRLLSGLLSSAGIVRKVTTFTANQVDARLVSAESRGWSMVLTAGCGTLTVDVGRQVDSRIE